MPVQISDWMREERDLMEAPTSPSLMNVELEFSGSRGECMSADSWVRRE